MPASPSVDSRSATDHADLAAHAAHAGVTEAELAEAWFDAPPASTRRSSVPPAPVGEFLGDPLADAWLR